MKANANQVVKMFSVPVENVRRQYAANATELRAMEFKAKSTGRKQGGFTAVQLAEFANHAETQSK